MLIFRKLPNRVADYQMHQLYNMCFTDQEWFSPTHLGKSSIIPRVPADEPIRSQKIEVPRQSFNFFEYVNRSDDSIHFMIDKKLDDFTKEWFPDIESTTTILTKTRKGCMQPPHKDKSRDYSIYIPIYPHMYDYSPMTFYYNNELQYIDNLDPGAMYLVNHKIMHSAFNFTDYDRFNLQITLKEENALRFI